MGGIGAAFAFAAAFGAAGPELLEEEFADGCAAAAEKISGAAIGDCGYGWLWLPDADISGVVETAAWLRCYDSIIHVGIGGSALGNLMLNQALLGDSYNERDRQKRCDSPRFYLADNPDPTKMADIWALARSGTVALACVSKSGATAETASQFLWFRGQMAAAFPNRDIDADILVITDENNGVLRAFAAESRCRSLVLPASVGGRYSVLSNAALTSAAALGIDVCGLLLGAKRMREYLTGTTEFWKNPAHIEAALHIRHEREGRPMNVLMPYSSRLERFAEWFAQLWGESLGKNGRGTTPVRALGAIDQHSQVQLYADGPDDKLYTLINVRQHGVKAVIPYAPGALRPVSYMSGADTGEMLKLEAESTAAALAKAGRPVIWIELEKSDAQSIGALIFYYEYMTALTGILMGIDPFDQPGVEQGKRYICGLMGRAGYEKDAEEAGRCFDVIRKNNIVL